MSNILCIGTIDNTQKDGLAQDACSVRDLKNQVFLAASAVHTSQEGSDHGKFYHIPTDILLSQVKECLHYQQIHAVKIGYLGTADVIEGLAELLVNYKKDHHLPLVIDPSILSSHKKQLIDKKALDSLKRDLILHADIITPSANEGVFLTGLEIPQSQDDMHHMADMLLTLGPKAVFLRGGKFQEGNDTDILATDSTHLAFQSLALSARGSVETLGSIVSSAIAVGLAQNRPFEKTIEQSLDYVRSYFLETI